MECENGADESAHKPQGRRAAVLRALGISSVRGESMVAEKQQGKMLVDLGVTGEGGTSHEKASGRLLR